MERYSRRQIVEAASVADGQVSNMKRVKKALGEDAGSYEKWLQAQNAAKGRTFEPLCEDEREAQLEAQASVYVERMSKAFGNKLSTNTSMAARVLSQYFGRNLESLVYQLRDYVEDEEFMGASEEELREF